VIPIAKKLMDEGIKTVSGSLMWSHSVILNMLRNEKYCGDALLQKTVTADDISFKRRKNQGEAPMAYIRDNHPAIIDRDTFELVQELRKERAKSKGYDPEMAWKYQARYPFTSKIICGQCGAKFQHTVHNSRSNKAGRWTCTTYVDDRKTTCEMKPIKDETIRLLFVRLFNKLYTNITILKSYKSALQMVDDAKTSYAKIKNYDARIEDLLKEERALFAVSKKGYLGDDMFAKSHTELIDNIELLRQERNKALAEINGNDERIGKTQKFISMMERRSSPMKEFDENVFELIIDKIVVHNRESLEFHLNNGLRLTENYTWQRGKDIV
jgi:hypothetical protein